MKYEDIFSKVTTQDGRLIYKASLDGSYVVESVTRVHGNGKIMRVLVSNFSLANQDLLPTNVRLELENFPESVVTAKVADPESPWKTYLKLRKRIVGDPVKERKDGDNNFYGGLKPRVVM